jgi:predicted metal-dependent phosphoesterase TrpH
VSAAAGRPGLLVSSTTLVVWTAGIVRGEFMRKLCLLVLGLALACAAGASAAPNVTNATQKGSLLIFPDIRVDGSWNTLVRLQNDGSRNVDVLCYWMDVENPELQAELRRLRDDRFRRGELMIDKLRALGFDVSFDRVREIAGGGNIVRPHIAQAMVEAGVVASEKEAFDAWIADGRPAHVAKHALDPVDAVALISSAGGVCVLAHPGMWGDQSQVPEGLIEAMAASGMGGLETDHVDHTPERRRHYRAVASRLGLVATGGSDCHGARYDPVRLGTSLCEPASFAALRLLAR